VAANLWTDEQCAERQVRSLGSRGSWCRKASFAFELLGIGLVETPNLLCDYGYNMIRNDRQEGIFLPSAPGPG
jgi:hypothetical protein